MTIGEKANTTWLMGTVDNATAVQIGGDVHKWRSSVSISNPNATATHAILVYRQAKNDTTNPTAATMQAGQCHLRIAGSTVANIATNADEAIWIVYSAGSGAPYCTEFIKEQFNGNV